PRTYGPPREISGRVDQYGQRSLAPGSMGWASPTPPPLPVHVPMPMPREAGIQVDYELVALLQAEVGRLVIDALRGEPSVTNDERRQITTELAEVAVRRNVDMRLRAGETGVVQLPGYERALCSAVIAY